MEKPDDSDCCNEGTAARSKQLKDTNQSGFSALNQAADQAERVVLRNALVQRNLPLVYSVTARMAPTCTFSSEDLRQIGSLGLLRAVEAFDPSHGGSLSSFAVPYIRGAIQHEMRDRYSLVRIPRALWDLRRRASVLQDRRRRLGLPQLAPTQLAEALGSSITRLLEALELGSVIEMRSLDAPAGAESESDGGRPLLDQVADPASLSDVGQDPDDPPAAGLEVTSPAGPATSCAATPRTWLQGCLEQLSSQERQLVVGHVCNGLGWAELGRELGMHPRQAQRRTLALLRRLQAEGRQWQIEQQLEQPSG